MRKLTLIVALLTLLMPFRMKAQNDLQSAYEAALAAIEDGGTYRISSVFDDTKYYLNTSGYLVADIKKAAIFTFKKMEGEEFPYGFQIDGVYFTNPDISGYDVALNSGHLKTNTHARNTWEAQVFFLNEDGKYAVRATNAYGGDEEWALTARTFWTVNEGSDGPVAEYTFDQPFIWQLEAVVDYRAEAIRIVTGWTYQLQERQGLVQEPSHWISNAKEPTGDSYDALMDGDYFTFFHSIWSSTGPSEDHYLQAELPEATQKFYIYFQKRQQNNVDRVTLLNISASNDGVNFEEITALDDGLPTEPEVISYSDSIDLGAAYKYVRFSVADVNDYLSLSTYNGHHWFTFSEFYILPDNKLTQEVLGYVINDFTEIDADDLVAIYALDEKVAKLFAPDSTATTITFADPAVKAICVANWDTDGDGELSYDEAAAVTDLGGVFKENKEITSFDELEYFTGLTSIGEFAFSNCDRLTSITIPEGINSIGNYAFYWCADLKSITIPNSVNSIGTSSFTGNFDLTTLTIPASVTKIASNAFYACEGLKSIVVDSENPVYDSRDYCNAIIETASNTLISGCQKTIIPSTVTGIGVDAFNQIHTLTSITIPEGVTSIGGGAFGWCENLTSITIPSTVSSFERNPFYGCRGITSIEVDFNNAVFDSRGNCNAIIETTSNTLIIGCQNTIIPSTVTAINEDAFYSCSYLKSICIPANVISIGNYAFLGCSNLTTITSYIKEPFVFGNDAFQFISDEAILYVPAGTRDAYIAAGWTEEVFKGGIVEMADITIPTEGLVAYYPFNGNANDESGHGNNGTPTESVTLTTGLHGDSNGAYQFGGYDNPGHIHIPNSESLQFSNAATISAYVKVSSLSGMDGWGSKVETGSMQCIWAKSHDRNGSAMFLSIRDQGLFVNVLPNTEWETFGNEAGNHELAGDYLNKWINIVCVYGDDGRNRLYINGELIAETETTPDFTEMNGEDLYLGKYSDYWYPLNGVLDEVCIYNRALSFDEIQEMAKYAEAPEVDTNIAFADANVKAICVSNWDTNGDGELSYDEAAAVTDLGEVFSENYDITSFDELQYFTGLTRIGEKAFYFCQGLTSVIIPECVTVIGNAAFFGCYGLTSITIPNSVTVIGNQAFSSCYVLTPIIIPNSVKVIENKAFSGCYRLTSVTIPNSVTAIGNEVFSGCYRLTSLVVDANNPIYDSREDCNAIIETGTNTLIAGCPNTVIPNSVTSIGNYAFSNCSGLTSITIPNSVTSIGEWAFLFCSDLTSVTIPNSVTSIGVRAFAGSDGLTSMVVDANNPIYDSRENCNAIIETATNTLIAGCPNTVIPNSVTSIGEGAFAYFNLTSITIPNSVTSIERGAFFGCNRLASIVIPESVTRIDGQAFGACVRLTSVTIPESVTSIGDGAFANCSSLTSIIIPGAVTSIGEMAFRKCTNLTAITSYIKEPFVLGIEDFAYISDEVILYVPAGTRDKYLAAGWTEEVFKGGVVEMTSDEKVTLTINVEGMGAVMIGGVAYEDEEQTIEVAKGSNVVMQFVPETEVAQYILGKLTVNGEAVTDEVVGGVYVLREVEEDATVSAIFVEDIDMFVVDGIKYGVPDPLEPIVKVMMYDYGEVVNVPASVVYNDKTWTVKGIGSYAFYDCSELKWLSIPATVETIERNVIKKCPRLAAITWHPAMKMPTTMATSERNPNRLYYVTDMQWAPNVGGDLNIVVGTENGTASTINLSDTEGNNDFYCPSAFTAGRISYRHYYAQHTQHRVCRGWESLVLPFDVADIRHEEKGTIAPFAALDEARIDAGEKPFWLYRYTEDGWARADKVEANVPYILSLPNEDFYEPEYRIGGYVTFEATNAQVQATTDEVLQGVQSGNLIFRPAFQKENFVSEKYLLNVSAAYNGHPEGSIFIRYFRGAHPFEGYFSQNGGAVKDFFSVFDEMLDGIEDIKNEELKDKNEAGAVYDLIGRKMSGNLPKGVYIQNGRKFTVK